MKTRVFLKYYLHDCSIKTKIETFQLKILHLIQIRANYSIIYQVGEQEGLMKNINSLEIATRPPGECRTANKLI